MMVNLNERPRHAPSAILKTLEFDDDRRYLIVEGEEDRMFFEYLCGEDFDPQVMLLEINSIDIPDKIEGGNKGRLVFMATNIPEQFTNRIRFFADRDYAQYTNQIESDRITFTDFRDIEGYLFEVLFVEKFLKVGIKTSKISAQDLIDEVSKAKFWSLIRIVAINKNVTLKVNATNERLTKYVKIDDRFKVSVDRDRYILALLNNSNHPIKISELNSYINELELATTNDDFRFLLHGKDAILLLSNICQKAGYKNGDVSNVIWMSFDKNEVKRYPNLLNTVEYLKTVKSLN